MVTKYRRRQMLMRSLQGLGDASSDASPDASTIYEDWEGFQVVAPGSASGQPFDSYTANYSDAAAGVGTIADALIPTIPWWVWVGGAGLLFLMLHHEFKK